LPQNHFLIPHIVLGSHGGFSVASTEICLHASIPRRSPASYLADLQPLM